MAFLSASLQLDDGFQIEFGVCEKQTGSCVCICVLVYEYEGVFMS